MRSSEERELDTGRGTRRKGRISMYSISSGEVREAIMNICVINMALTMNDTLISLANTSLLFPWADSLAVAQNHASAFQHIATPQVDFEQAEHANLVQIYFFLPQSSSERSDMQADLVVLAAS
jgi:hypothetical protein